WASTGASACGSSGELHQYLDDSAIVGISEIDTRMLTRHLRTHGAKRGVISTASADRDALIGRARGSRSMIGLDLAREVTCDKPYRVEEPIASVLQGAIPVGGHYKVVAYDFGMKRNIVRMLAASGCDVTVVPATTSGEETLALKPDGVFLSNGPGDPEPCTYAIDNIRRLMGRQPIFGICLGHQLTGIALGGKTFKLKFGHHGGNHPVKQLNTGKLEITANNHNFAVDPDSLPQSEVELTHVDLNDSTLEGMRHRNLPLFSVQYHPEASPGPHDSHYLFKD